MRNFLTKAPASLIEFLVVLPVILMTGVYFIDNSSLTMWMLTFPFLMIAGLIFRIIIPSKKEWVYLSFSVITSSLTTFLIVHSIPLILLSLLYGITLTYRASKYSVNHRNELFPSSYLWVIGLPIYIVGYLVFRYKELLVDYLSVVSWAGLILLIVTLLSANDEHLKAATLSKKARPMLTKTLKRQNRFFIVFTIIFALLLTNLHLIQALVYQAIYQTVKGIIWLFTLREKNDSPPEEQPQQSQSFFPAEEAVEPSLLAIWLERIMYVVVAIFLIGLVIFIIYILIKRFGAGLRRSFSWISRFLNQLFGQKNDEFVNQSFTDEKENIFDWNAFKTKQKEKITNAINKVYQRQPNWQRMSEENKVRYIYRYLLREQVKHGYSYKPSFTVRETIGELQEVHPEHLNELKMLSEIYEQIKYGNKKDVVESNIEELIALIKQ